MFRILNEAACHNFKYSPLSTWEVGIFSNVTFASQCASLEKENTMDKIFVSHLTCAATFPMSTQVSQLCSSELQLSHSLTFLLLLHPPRLLHPQDESDQGVKGKLGSRRTCAQKGNLVLFSALLTVRSPTL